MAGDRSAAFGWLALVAGMALLAGCDDAGKDAQAKAGPPPPEVTVAAPLVQKLTEWDEFTGRFEAVQQVEVRARVAGYLQEIRFQDGQHVEQGHRHDRERQQDREQRGHEGRRAELDATGAVIDAKQLEVLPSGAATCILRRFDDQPVSYVEIMPASDFRALVVRPGTHDQPFAEWQLFADFLEKGVIRRARDHRGAELRFEDLARAGFGVVRVRRRLRGRRR